MSWRPDNWKNPYYKTEEALGAEVFWNQYPEFGIFEAGADAMGKGIVEWLDTFEFYDDALGESARAFRDAIKQVLLRKEG